MTPAAGTFQSQDYILIFSEQTELAVLFPFRTKSKLSKQAIEQKKRNLLVKVAAFWEIYIRVYDSVKCHNLIAS